MFLMETKLYAISGTPSGEPFAKNQRRFRVIFVSTTLLWESPAELTENRPSAGKIETKNGVYEIGPRSAKQLLRLLRQCEGSDM